MLTFDVEATQTILALKELVQEKEGIAVNQMRLIYKGAQLCVEGSGGREVEGTRKNSAAAAGTHPPPCPCARATRAAPRWPAICFSKRLTPVR